MSKTFLKILIITAVVSLTATNSVHAGWSTGKYGSAIDFNGSSNYIDGFGAMGNIKTVSFWIKADSTTEDVIDLNGTQTITVTAGTISANNFTSPTIYVDGVISSNLADTNWHHIAITTGTNVSASAVVIGKVSASYFDGKLDEVRIYDYARIADEIRLDYQAGMATHLGPSGKNCSEDPAGCMDYGLVGSWGMDEGAGTTAYDSSDNSNDGTLGGDGTASKMPKWSTDSSPNLGGAGGGSLEFDGVDDYVDLGDDESLNITGEITVEAWIKINEFSDSFTRVYTNKLSNTHPFTFGIRGTTTPYLAFADVNNVDSLLSVSTLEANKWIHAVVVSTGSQETAKMYINGEDNTGTTNGGGFTFSNITNIGSYSGSSHFFNGLIGEVRVYNRALSADEVRYHYNKGGPVAEWKFNEGEGSTAFDSSINRNNGTLTNMASPSTSTSGWGEGKYGSGLVFDGSNDYVDCGNDASLDLTTKATISLWIYPNSVTGSYIGLVGRTNSPNYNYILRTTNGILQFRAWAGTADTVETSTAIIDINEWQYITAIVDLPNVYLYKNGVLVKSDTPTFTSLDNGVASDTNIGVYQYSTPVFFNGSIDDVRIYNYARTVDEILVDYNAGVATHLGPSEKTCSEDPAGCMDYGLVGSWGMDEGAGTTAYDSSDEGNDGSLTNGPKWTTDSPPNQIGGGSLSFDGADDYVLVATSIDDSLDITDAITMEAWVNPSVITGKDRVITKKGGVYYFQIDDTGELEVYFYGTTSPGYHKTTATIPINTWTHVAVTYNGANVILYINGSGQSFDNTGSLVSDGDDVYIGSGDVSVRQFQGSIDEARIYNRALSAEEVRYHYNKGGPVAEWKFNEGEGTTAFDSSINRNNGTLTNFDWTTTSGWGEGKYGSGLVFDGNNDYVDMNDVLDFNNDENRTFEAWIKKNSLSDIQNIISKQDLDSPWSGWSVVTNNQVIRFEYMTDTSDWLEVSSTNNIITNTGQWYYVVVSYYSDKTVKMYLNGIEIATTVETNTLSSDVDSSISLNIGGRDDGSGEVFNGTIDEMRIYNYVRTADEILVDYNAGVATHFR